jgi:hypothetical protein
MKYNFSEDKSLIKEIEIFNRGKSLEALIHVPTQSNNGDLTKIKEGLQSYGYDVMAGVDGNNAVLKVFGFETANNLLTSMSNIQIGDNRAVSGDYQATKNERDEAHSIKDDNWQKRAAILTAGSLYTVGNFSTIAAGIVRGNTSEALQGLAWAGPGLGLMMSGLQTADTQMPFLYNDFNEFLQQNDIKVPNNVQNLLDERKTDNNLWDKTWRLATGNASNAFAACEAIGAGLGIKAGIELKNPYKSVASAVMGAGMVTSLLTEEKHPKYKESLYLGNGSSGSKVPEPEKNSGGLLGLLEEHPMIAAGALANVQNAIKIAGIFEVDVKKRMDFDGVLNADATAKIKDLSPDKKDAWILEQTRQGEDIWGESKQGILGRIASHKIEGKYYKDKIELEQKQFDVAQKLSGLTQDSDEYKQAILAVNKAQNEIQALDKQRETYIKNDRAAKLDGLAIGSFIVANAITMVTSKDNTPDLLKSGGVDSLVEISANIVMDYPEDAQKVVAQRLATFIANHQYVKLNVDDVVSMINNKMEVLQSVSWLGQNVEFKPFERADGASFELVKASQNPNSKVEGQRASLEKLYGAEAAVSESEELNSNKTKLEKILSREEVASQTSVVGV